MSHLLDYFLPSLLFSMHQINISYLFCLFIKFFLEILLYYYIIIIITEQFRFYLRFVVNKLSLRYLPHTLLSILVNPDKHSFFPVWNSPISELREPTPEKDCHIKLHHTCGKKHINMLLSADSLVHLMVQMCCFHASVSSPGITCTPCALEERSCWELT